MEQTKFPSLLKLLKLMQEPSLSHYLQAGQYVGYSDPNLGHSMLTSRSKPTEESLYPGDH